MTPLSEHEKRTLAYHCAELEGWHRHKGAHAENFIKHYTEIIGIIRKVLGNDTVDKYIYKPYIEVIREQNGLRQCDMINNDHEDDLN